MIEKVCTFTHVFVKGTIIASPKDVSPVRLMSKDEQTLRAQDGGTGSAGGKPRFNKQAFTNVDIQLE